MHNLQPSDEKTGSFIRNRRRKGKITIQSDTVFQDDIFTKALTLISPESFVAAKIKYHPTCLRSYEHKHE